MWIYFGGFDLYMFSPHVEVDAESVGGEGLVGAVDQDTHWGFLGANGSCWFISATLVLVSEVGSLRGWVSSLVQVFGMECVALTFASNNNTLHICASWAVDTNSGRVVVVSSLKRRDLKQPHRRFLVHNNLVYCCWIQCKEDGHYDDHCWASIICTMTACTLF